METASICSDSAIMVCSRMTIIFTVWCDRGRWARMYVFQSVHCRGAYCHIVFPPPSGIVCHVWTIKEGQSLFSELWLYKLCCITPRVEKDYIFSLWIVLARSLKQICSRTTVVSVMLCYDSEVGKSVCVSKCALQRCILSYSLPTSFRYCASCVDN